MVGLGSLEGTRSVLSLSRGMIGFTILVICFAILPEKIVGIWILELFIVPGGLYLGAILSSQYPMLCFAVHQMPGLSLVHWVCRFFLFGYSIVYLWQSQKSILGF